MKVKLSMEDVIFRAIALIFVWFIIIVTLYPFLYVLSSSISDPKAVIQGEVFLWPVGFSLKAYEIIFSYDAVKIGYLNTIFYTVAGTFINMLLTTFMAYPLSKRSLVFRKYFVFMVVFTMLFSGGLIPTFLIVKNMGMVDTRWALLIPMAVSAWNLILLKTFFESLPQELEEAARIDGASNLQVLSRIILPLSKPAIATMSLFYAVGHWNSFFPALIYLWDESLFPIQIFLRNIVLLNMTADAMDSANVPVEDMIMGESVKMATIMVVAVPIICVYPFIQKYFAKGVMIGSLKG